MVSFSTSSSSSAVALILLISSVVSLVASAPAEHDLQAINEKIDDSLPDNEKTIDEYITGGVNASSGEFPWHVSIQYVQLSSNYHLCSGSIIDVEWILTTALCVDYLKAAPYNVRVVAGRLSLYNSELDDQSRPVEKIIVNSAFKIINNPYSVTSDIALLKLSTPLTITRKVQIIPLPPQGLAPPEGTSRVVGYDNDDQTLQQAPVLKLDNALCQIWLGTGYLVNTNQICGVGANGIAVTSNSDQGSSLTHSNHQFLNGIYSFGSDASKKDGSCQTSSSGAASPGVYTRVSDYITWINTNKK